MQGKTSSDESSQEMPKGAAPTTWVVRPDPDLEDLIPSFLQNRKNELADMDQAISQSDFDHIRRTAHTWKGISRPYGFVHLETLSRELETAGESENKSEVERILSDIRTYLLNVRVVYEN